MTLIERQHVGQGMPLGKHDDRRIGKTDPKRSMRFDHRPRTPYVAAHHRLQRIRASLRFFWRPQAAALADPSREQTVKLSEYNRRQRHRTIGTSQRGHRLLM